MTDVRTTTDPRVGSQLGSRYRLEARLAAGGMATVYRARDEILDRPVAVKVMHPALAQSPGFVERFRREAQNAARLNHPNVVTVHDGGQEGDAVFIVMELVEGTPLREMLDRFGRLDVETTRHVVAGVAAALDHAHAKGLVHRDVKPENVLLTPDGRVKVVDFGVAKALADDAAKLTGEAAIGTMFYIAPEQLQRGEVDRRADVYALGAMTYEMLTGRPPFAGDSPAAVAAARFNQSVPSPGAGPEVDAAVGRATALRPDDRFDTAGEFARALGDPAAASPTHLRETMEVSLPAPAVTPMPTTVMPLDSSRPRRRVRRRWPWVALLVAILAAAGATGYAVFPKSTLVPDLAGMDGQAAVAALKQADLLAGASEEVFHDAAPPGQVLRTDPPADRRVREGTTVKLFVSKGPELFDVPSVVDKPLEEARMILEEAGFTSGEETEAFHDAIPAGDVVEQSLETKARKGTVVNLVVSKGPELRTIPNVSGKTPEDATASLQGAGFAVERTEDFSESIAQGKVIGTAPAGGKQAPKGSKVTIVISKGPKPFPMPNLVGMSRDAAKEKAQSLGLIVGNEYAVPGSGKPSGEVQGQNPPAGTEVRKGAKIDLYYSA